jgi:hypothetical protein
MNLLKNDVERFRRLHKTVVLDNVGVLRLISICVLMRFDGVSHVKIFQEVNLKLL